MQHYGDITKIKGAEVPIVDVVTGGSPCQDLSVAGKRAGLGGERSGLFMEQIRIVKEMREHDRRTNHRTGFMVRPRYMVWENVPGAFSSNKGKDFQAVLTEIVRITDENAPDVPMPEKAKWSRSGCLYDEMGRWSVAWRVHDAQFWGVSQRRKRIALVADFGGESAPEILFERKGMSGDITESGKEGEGAASDAGAGIEKTSRAISFQERAGKPGGGKGILIQDERTGALSTLNNQSVCIGIDAYNHTVSGDEAATLNASSGESPTRSGPSVMTFESGAPRDVGETIGFNRERCGAVTMNDAMPTLQAAAGESGNNQPMVVYGISAYESNAMKSGNPNSGVYEAMTARTLDLNGGSPACNQGGMAVVQAMGMEPLSIGHDIRSAKFTDDGVTDPLTATDYKDPIKISTYQKVTGCLDCGITKGTGNQLANNDMFVANTSVVRRLTPLECERLQGYPDGWTDIGDWIDSKGKKHKGESDSPRYKALGNSIALPFWFWLLRRISAQYERPATLGSLFDGIGGFPYCWEKCNGEGTAIWASEIEEFPIAVTKMHFPEE